MHDDLYFLRILIEAFKSPHPRQALTEAFQQIEGVRFEPRYQTGYLQFQRFMEEVVSAYLERLPRIELRLVSVAGTIYPLVLTEAERRFRAKGILPDRYQLEMSTGWLLWEDELTGVDLLWTLAFPSEELPLAADTGVTSRFYSREIVLLDGELILRIFPGLESGSLEVEWDCSRGGTP